MRVLVCDQESEMLESVARWFEVDTATSKVTCIDLMRANPFDVVIASERLSDGSGLELLSHVATRWPETLRVLVIEPARLKLLRGKLGPFRLHATMRYPIEEDELETVLNRMGELMVAPEAEEEPEPEPPPPPPSPVATTRVQKVTLPQQATKANSLNTRSSVSTGAGRGTGQAGPGERDLGKTSAQTGPAHSGREQVALGQHASGQHGSGQRPSGQSGSAQTGSAQTGSAQTGLGQSGVGRSGLGQAASGQTASGRSASARATPPFASAAKLNSRSAKSAAPLGAPRAPEPPTVRRKLGNYTPLGAPEDEQMRIVEREFDRTAAPLAARAMRVREEASRPRSQKEKLGGLASHLSETLKKLLKR